MDRLPPAPASPVFPGGGVLHGLTAGDLGLDPVADVLTGPTGPTGLTGVTEIHEARW